MRAIRPVILSAAQDLVPRTQRSFATLRMTGLLSTCPRARGHAFQSRDLYDIDHCCSDRFCLPLLAGNVAFHRKIFYFVECNRQSNAVTLQNCSPPAAAHPGLEWVRILPPQVAKSAPTPDSSRTAVGSEESRRGETCIVTMYY